MFTCVFSTLPCAWTQWTMCIIFFCMEFFAYIKLRKKTDNECEIDQKLYIKLKYFHPLVGFNLIQISFYLRGFSQLFLALANAFNIQQQHHMFWTTYIWCNVFLYHLSKSNTKTCHLCLDSYKYSKLLEFSVQCKINFIISKWLTMLSLSFGWLPLRIIHPNFHI